MSFSAHQAKSSVYNGFELWTLIFFASFEQIAADLKSSIFTVRREIYELQKAELLETVQRYRKKTAKAVASVLCSFTLFLHRRALEIITIPC